jgi:hypothetical protein
MNMKKFASHTIAVVVGLILATCTRSPRVEIVEKEVLKEVPVEVVKEVVVERVVTKTKTEVVYRYAPPYIVELHKTLFSTYKIYHEHRFSIFGGVGPVGLKISPVLGGYKVKTKRDLVIGAGYSYNLDSRFSVGLLGLSNATFLGSIGYSF